MRVAIFGGSFNPIHIGHIELSEIFIDKLAFDKVLIIPTCMPPHKVSKDMATSEQRIEMCKIATINKSYIEVSDIEVKRGGASYTYQTILALKEIYRNDELFLIVGADMFLTLQDWKNPDIILKNVTVCTVPRNADSYDILVKHNEYLASIGAKCEIISVPLTQVSSTFIRESIKKGDDVSDLLPNGVYEYIIKNNLYRGE